MRCILMNKDMPVVELELDDDTATILKVMKSFELDFLPVGIDVKNGIPNKNTLEYGLEEVFLQADWDLELHWSNWGFSIRSSYC